MQLTRVEIRNFRGLEEIALDLAPTTVLIGENNAGKSSVLDAVNAALSRALSRAGSAFEELDHRLPKADAKPADAPPLSVTLKFEEAKAGEWDNDLVTALFDAITNTPDDRKSITFEVRGSYDRSLNAFRSDWRFLNAEGTEMRGAKLGFGLVRRLQQAAPVYFLRAERSAADHFDTRSTFWRPFLDDPQVPDDQAKALAKQLEALNATIFASDSKLQAVHEHLAKVAGLVPVATESPVAIDVLPREVWDLLSRAQVRIGGRSGAKLPLSSHGSGMQSLSVLFLFEAFLAAMLARRHEPFSRAILLLEEPEAHLHPGACRALWRTMSAFPGQAVVATHSGQLLAHVPLEAIRRLYWDGGRVRVGFVPAGTLTTDERRGFEFHIQAARGDLMFAPCWLLVEGPTDYLVVTGAAGPLGYALDEAGVHVVCFTNAKGGVAMFAKVADALGIRWHLLVDGDPSGDVYRKKVEPLLRARPPEAHITQIPDTNIEEYLYKGGFADVYESSVSEQVLKRVAVPKGDPSYARELARVLPTDRKVECAHAVVERMREQGAKSVPKHIQHALDAAVRLAAAGRGGAP